MKKLIIMLILFCGVSFAQVNINAPTFSSFARESNLLYPYTSTDTILVNSKTSAGGTGSVFQITGRVYFSSELMIGSAVDLGAYALQVTGNGNVTTDLTVGNDILLANGSVVGITGNEIITFLAAGSINITGATFDVDGAATATSFASDAGITTGTTTIYTPNAASNAPTTVSDDGAITVTNTIMRVDGVDADALLDTDPAINDGASDGQIVIIQGTSDGATVTIADNVNTQLNGAANCTLGDGDVICLMFDSNYSMWIELYRTNN